MLILINEVQIDWNDCADLYRLQKLGVLFSRKEYFNDIFSPRFVYILKPSLSKF